MNSFDMVILMPPLGKVIGYLLPLLACAQAVIGLAGVCVVIIDMVVMYRSQLTRPHRYCNNLNQLLYPVANQQTLHTHTISHTLIPWLN